mgnify:CR=1 FL=1
MTRDPARSTVRITIRDMPPSANAMRSSFIVGGKVHSAKSKAYAAWKEAAAWEIAAARPGRIDGPYRLSIAVQRDWRSKRDRDIDNTIKPISDALVSSSPAAWMCWSHEIFSPGMMSLPVPSMKRS